MPQEQTNPILACHECDLLQQLPEKPEVGAFYCARCGALIRRRSRNSIETTLALLIAGLILFVIANLFPFMSLNANGQVQDSTLFSSSLGLFQSDQRLLAGVVFLTTIVFPLADLLGMLFVLVSVQLHHQGPESKSVFRFLQQARPWGMVEIFMLGVMVAMVKLGDLATVIPGIALYAFGLLIFVLAAANYSLDPEEVWMRLDHHRS
ncbi:MAG: paraquat-inducible protein A [bacterium]